MRSSSIDRAFLLLAFIQLGLEFHSINLFLWPLNHSCARPPSRAQQQHHQSSSFNFSDSRRNPVDPDAIQTNLFDAYADDPFTLARARSMGIKYDDIAGCLQYKQELDQQTTVDLTQLELCAHGLHFERPQLSLSVVAFFELACARQYLTILMPNAFALGLLVGISLTSYLLLNRGVASCADESGTRRSAVVASTEATTGAPPTTTTTSTPIGSFAMDLGEQRTEKVASSNLYYWLLLQIVAGLIVQIQTYSLGRSVPEQEADEDDHGEAHSSRQHPELYGQFVLAILLRAFIAGSNLTRILIVWRNQKKLLPATNSSLSAAHELFTANRGGFLLFGAIFIGFKALLGPAALRLLAGWWQLAEWLAAYSFCLTMMVFAREWLAQAQDEDDAGGQLESELDNQLVSETNLDQPGINVGTASAAGRAFSGCEFCSLAEQPIRILDNPYLATTTQQLAHRTTSSHENHSLSSAFADRNLISRLVLLTFCLSCDYFLLQMMPDHSLLHSESTASRLKRKLSYAEELSALGPAKELDDLHRYDPIAPGTNDSTSVRSSDNGTFYHDETSFLSHHRSEESLRAKQFDYRSINQATKSMDIMQNSWNPFEILWATAKLNKWPLDLLMVLVHLSCLSNFETVYFKLSRLFVLVELGAKFLVLEWLAIGVLRREDHLLEWAWLRAACLLLAQLSSCLMLYNYINTMLKLNRRLQTSKLMLFVPNTMGAALALLVASYAPLLEWLDLAIIPVGLVLINLIVIVLTGSLKERFKASLCPMIFESQQPARSGGRMILLANPSDTN